jgi:amidase
METNASLPQTARRIAPRITNLEEVARLSALDQSALLRSGEVSVEELTRACIARIARWEPELGAFVDQASRRAVMAARALDRDRRRNPSAPRSPLWGLPTAMKDIQLVRGMPMRLGSRAFRYAWSPFDDVSTRALRDAGLVILGKLATSEMAILPFVDTDIHPPCRNPWDATRYSGGSSGGSGAAVAAGLIPIAVGSDGAGSIRIPAAFCGLVGHKPTRGALPNPAARFEKLGMSTVGALARTVDDAAALFDVLAGSSHGPRSLLDASKRVTRKPLRVRLAVTSPVADVEPAIASAVQRVGRTLSAMGHTLEDPPELCASVEEFLPVFRYMTSRFPVLSESLLQPTTQHVRAAGRRVSYEEARSIRDRFTAMVDTWFGDADLILTPTVGASAPAVGRWTGAPPEELFAEAAMLGAFTAVFNASGNPAVSIPVWPGDSNAERALPVGVQIIARRGEDAMLLAVARAALEAEGAAVAPLAAHWRS